MGQGPWFVLSIQIPREAHLNTIDPSGLAVLPGTVRLLPRWKVDRWFGVVAKWAKTIHAGKYVPIPDVDPGTLPCLIAGEPNWHDTVPLARASVVNCDGTSPMPH